jgi:hypothetical protein
VEKLKVTLTVEVAHQDHFLMDLYDLLDFWCLGRWFARREAVTEDDEQEAVIDASGVGDDEDWV